MMNHANEKVSVNSNCRECDFKTSWISILAIMCMIELVLLIINNIPTSQLGQNVEIARVKSEAVRVAVDRVRKEFFRKPLLTHIETGKQEIKSGKKRYYYAMVQSVEEANTWVDDPRYDWEIVTITNSASVLLRRSKAD